MDSIRGFWISLAQFDLDLEHTIPHCIQWPEHCVTTEPWLYTTQNRWGQHGHDPQKDIVHFWISLKTQPITCMALVRELQHSMSNIGSQTDEATRSAWPVITFFCFHHNFLRLLRGTLIQTQCRLIPEVITTKKQKTTKPLVRLNQLRCWKTPGQEVSMVIFSSCMMPLIRCCKKLNLPHD